MTRRKWTPAELAHLAAIYPHQRSDAVAKELNRPLKSVHDKAYDLGIKKTAAFMASPDSGILQKGQQHPESVASQFKPGLVPWNAGRKGWQAGGRSVGTQFHSGMMPKNTMPVGSHRIVTSQGVPRLEQKMNETPGPNHLRWVPVARLVWEAAHGPIPKGNIVVFKRGMASLVAQEITADRLLCITRREHAQRNHPRSHSPEVAALCQLKGAITRQVNRITREHTQTQGHAA